MGCVSSQSSKPNSKTGNNNGGNLIANGQSSQAITYTTSTAKSSQVTAARRVEIQQRRLEAKAKREEERKQRQAERGKQLALHDKELTMDRSQMSGLA